MSVGVVGERTGSDEMRRFGIFILAVGALVLAGVAGAAISTYMRDHNSPSTASTTTTVGGSTTTTTLSVASRGAVAVLVANGTLEANAAGHFTQVLHSQGWNTTTAVNATTQVPATAIYYSPNEQAAAAAIATEIGAAATSVQAMTSSVPVPSTSGLNVVVIIGPDLAAQGFPTT
jgi:hypothetical protein